MAQPFCTGPAYLYCGVGVRGAPVFLGTTESTPIIEERPDYEPLMNDLGGSRKPFDFSFQGVDAIVQGTLTRWNQTVLNLMRRFGGLAVGGQSLAGATGELGAFMFFEGRAFQLWVAFPYAVKPSMANPATGGPMLPGYHFYGAFLEPPISSQVGTRPMKVSITLYCGRIFTLNPLAESCYDHNMIAVAGLPIN